MKPYRMDPTYTSLPAVIRVVNDDDHSCVEFRHAVTPDIVRPGSASVYPSIHCFTL